MSWMHLQGAGRAVKWGLLVRSSGRTGRDGHRTADEDTMVRLHATLGS
jgi:hypothetical protein